MGERERESVLRVCWVRTKDRAIQVRVPVRCIDVVALLPSAIGCSSVNNNTTTTRPEIAIEIYRTEYLGG